MSETAPASGVRGTGGLSAPKLDKFKNWKPEVQSKALEMIRERERVEWHPFYCLESTCNGYAHCAPKWNKECDAPRGHRWAKTKVGTFVCKSCKVGGILLDEWDFNHARADQRPPPWKKNWRAWIYKAGRGAGKTEAGSRLTHVVTKHTARIILVAATGPDFRDTMVEGESGILATSPPGKRPTWEPSLKKLTWPNGCIAKGYSAEEPDRLRGPQCLIAGTMIRTEHGARPIEQIREGERVWTRLGLREVIGTASKVDQVMTLERPEGGITGTYDHPVWTENRGWVRMDSITPDDTLVVWNGRSTRPGERTAMPTASTTSEHAGSTSKRSARSLTDTRYTTSTWTTPTTALRTLWRSLQRRIERSIRRHQSRTPVAVVTVSSSNTEGVRADGALTASGKWIESRCADQTLGGRTGSSPASSALQSSAPAVARSAALPASTAGVPVYDLTISGVHEFFANDILVHNSGFIWMDEAAHFPLIEEVWSNALLGMRIGKPSHALVTSTPTPTKWMKKTLANPKTLETTVSTYENLDNLDPNFRELITDEFEGTSRGKQELHGEVAEDVEGSLWKMHMIRRIAKVPEGDVTMDDGDEKGYTRAAVTLIRIVVSVDPAGTANARSDETGIVVVGLGDDNNLYVLADYTGKYSPAGWADRAVNAFEQWSADAIVAEKNYGGDMVRNTLEKTKPAGGVAPRIIEVTSRRGKAIRAEPMVGLYEKGKVFHVVGTMLGRTGLDLVDLEDEMTTWVPGSGPSPNRVDALVHALTELGKGIIPSTMALPSEVLANLRAPVGGGAGRPAMTSIPGL